MLSVINVFLGVNTSGQLVPSVLVEVVASDVESSLCVIWEAMPFADADELDFVSSSLFDMPLLLCILLLSINDTVCFKC